MFKKLLGVIWTGKTRARVSCKRKKNIETTERMEESVL
jgi:hypothetical protein